MRYRSLTLFFLLLAMLAMLIASNVDTLIRLTINSFTDVHISELKGFRPHWQHSSIDTLVVDYQQMHIVIRDIRVGFDLDKLLRGQQPYPENIHIANLKLSPTSDKEKNLPATNQQQTSDINFDDYRPNTWHDALKDLDLEIDTLTLEDFPQLQRMLEFKQLQIQPRTANTITIAFTFHEPVNGSHIPVQLSVSKSPTQDINEAEQEEAYQLHIPLSQNNHLDMKWIFYEDGEHFVIHQDVDMQADKLLQNIIDSHWHESLAFDIEHLDLALDNHMKLHRLFSPTQLIKALSTSRGSLGITVRLSPHHTAIEQVSVDTRFAFDINNTASNKLTAQLSFPQKEFARIRFNQNDPALLANRSLRSLARQDLIIQTPASSTWNIAAIRNEKHGIDILGENIFTIDWSLMGNLAYLDSQIDKLSISFADSLVSGQMDYQMKGRWNEALTTDHQASLGFDSNLLFNDRKGKHHFSLSLSDKRLFSTLAVEASLKNNQVLANFSTDTRNFSGKPAYLNDLLSLWDSDIKLLDGSLLVNGQLSATLRQTQTIEKLDYRFNTQLSNLYVDYDGFLFSAISSKGAFKGNQQSVNGEATVLVSDINAGITFSKLKALANFDYHFDKLSRIDISRINAQLLGGKLRGEDFTLYLPHESSEDKRRYYANLHLFLEDIQLANILALSSNNDIEGKGLLYGELPIYIDDQQNIINKGFLRNKAPGFLRYRPDPQARASMAQNPQMALLIQVLTHLNYHELYADLDLDAKGLMHLQGSIKGVNPDFKQGYPIHFNPNIELDFADMIRSLQFSDDISKRVQKRSEKKSLD